MRKSIISKIKNWQIIVATTTATLGAAYGGYKWIVAHVENTIEERTDRELILEKLDNLEGNDIMIMGKLYDHGDSLDRIEKLMEKNGTAIWMLKRQVEYEREHRDEYTRDQMNQQLKDFEELLKKNGIDPTVYIERNSEDITRIEKGNQFSSR